MFSTIKVNGLLVVELTCSVLQHNDHANTILPTNARFIKFAATVLIINFAIIVHTIGHLCKNHSCAYYVFVKGIF